MGDATVLPFGNESLEAVIAAHVLHLIPEWRRAVGETHRALRSGGIFLQTRGTAPGKGSEVSKVFFNAAGNPDWPPGATRNEEVDRAAAEMGFDIEELDELTAPTRIDLYEVVDQLEQGFFSACWGLDGRTARRCRRDSPSLAADTARWAAGAHRRQHRAALEAVPEALTQRSIGARTALPHSVQEPS